MKGYAATARAIAGEGIGSAFVCLGDAILDIAGALDAERHVRIVQARHEGAAVAMAEGFAIATGEPGVSMVTSGPGIANACLSLTECGRAGAPVVVLTGRADAGGAAQVQSFDHRALAGLAGAGYHAVDHSARLLPTIAHAFHEARAHRRAVIVDVLASALDDDVDAATYVPAQRFQPDVAEPDPAVIEAVIAVLADAARPIVIAGEGARRAGAGPLITELAERIGALLATTLPARGLFHGDPFDLGVAGHMATDVAIKLFAESDCVIAVGARLGSYTTRDGNLFPQARVVHIDIDPTPAMADHRGTGFVVAGDASDVVRSLLERVDEAPSRPGWRDLETRQALAYQRQDLDDVEDDGAGVDPRRLCRAIDSALPSDAAVVTGVGHFWGFPVMHIHRLFEPQLFTHYFGAVGQALPTGAGVAAALPDRPVVVIEGDGGLMMNVAELETLAAEQLHVMVVVFNDRALGAEAHKLSARGFAPGLAHRPDTDIAAVARSLGCRSSTLTDVDQAPHVIDEFLAAREPYVVDCRISRSFVTAPYQRAHRTENKESLS